MLGMLLGTALLTSSPSTDAALALCKTALERKAEGEIGTIEVDSAKGTARDLTIRGQLTASYGMGPAPPGSARTHHLGRVDFTYRCRVRHGRVREAALNPLHG